jgi:integrase
MNELTVIESDTLALVGQIANGVAAKSIFVDYRDRKAPNTVKRQDGDLSLFARYLAQVGVMAGDLATDPSAWEGITWGLVAGFVQWQLKQGYAVGSVNVRLSTIKTYSKLAMQAGALDPAAYVQIRAVSGYGQTEGKRINERREQAGIETRTGTKKSEPIELSQEQVKALKAQTGDTPQGRRDALLMCLLLDHGLRVSEIIALQVEGLDLERGEMTFYRKKTDKIQTHKLTPDSLKAATAYLAQDAPDAGLLLRSSRKGGQLTTAGMTRQAVSRRVKALGRRIGVEGLSAHDCRHTWATLAARNGTPIDRLQDAGGWSSPAMPLRYVQAAAIANEGVLLE